MSEPTIQLYNQDSYIKTFQATVLTCVKQLKEEQPDKPSYIVTLDVTAFFPEGGGQPSDTGNINGIIVIDVQEDDGIIYHIMEAPLSIGETVSGEINWDRRFDLMQHHTAEHIISGLIHKYFGYDNVGFHLGSEVVTIDFNGNLTEEDIRNIELKANLAVYENVPIKVTYPSSQELKELDYRSKKELSGNIRIVTIPGYDICACCAPHVALTGEIGGIKITSYQKYKGGVRISMLSGIRSLKDYNKKEKSVTDISVILSAKPDEVKDAVKNLKNENQTLKGQLLNVQNQILAYKAAAFQTGTDSICVFDKDVASASLRTYGNLLLEFCKGICAVFTTTDDQEYKYVLASKTMDVRPLGKSLNETFGGKGGGSKEMVQGSVRGKKEDIEAFINNIKI
ncbi:alanyl-tRNA editing protein [Anaerocolumna sp. MB42-C2]|uniref:alanyl-tRNA editing protein n=1 Tax=Anaerocolumna sp. MB42-C2 TaxID=3070997 RepID=UPI0027DF51CB|nr:alanine--tRNA ligase-related protein [Anaerocolumna sp. MB42-C2]WMJ88143.1 alanine--tRNA ligase-related protein [Anaerocolumna sp. MB42-C2]